MSNQRYIISINGIVQGVGFRPFVFKLAKNYRLTGWVKNFPGGVQIEAEGGFPELESFMESLTKDAPPLSYIDTCRVVKADTIGYRDFTIRESENDKAHEVYISPDVAVCEDCLKEMEDPTDRRYGYPFINCTNCGPRFTIITGIPYDRVNTTMAPFNMCEDCGREYKDASDRRFHAQPVACPKCGPEVILLDCYGKKVETEDAVEAVKLYLREGHIIAVKGLGGYHLACDARNPEAVRELRKRKVRDGKPFALMAKDLAAVEKYCIIDDQERKMLESWKRPIVLLKRKDEDALPYEAISADNQLLGIMLPYTPLHRLILSDGLDILVMTSGNRSGEPVYYKDEEAVEGLKGIADYFLASSREIYIRTDDSVTSIFKGKEYVIRRSRGYVPFPIDISAAANINGEEMNLNVLPGILACGGELKSTFGLVKGLKAFMSHHIGDLENMETLKAFEEGIEHFKKIFAVSPEVIVYDSHPEYLSSKYALEAECKFKIPVQHHRAHIAACMAENRLSEPIIGVAFDGTGYGDDGNIWGGEFFIGDYSVMERSAHLAYVDMPGGEMCIREPWRMAFSYLYKSFGDEAFRLPLACMETVERSRLEVLKQQLDRKINAPSTSSMGRLFDAVSAITGLCSVITYEGEAAIKLEKVCTGSAQEGYTYMLEEAEFGPMIIKTENMIRSVVEDVVKGTGIGIVSDRFHRTVVNMIVEVCKLLRSRHGLESAALSGGVFQNRILLKWAVEELEKEGFTVYTHSKVPANDGGIALGQAAIGLRKCIELGYTE